MRLAHAVFDAVVLAGGEARRLGGVDKPGLYFAGRTALDRVLAAVAGAATTVVVGPNRPTERPVVWCREQPPGAGPVAALRTGLARTSAERVVVLAADLPLVDTDTVRDLVTAAAGRDGAMLIDSEGRGQYLLAAYTRTALEAALADLPAWAPVRRVVARLDLADVPDRRGVGADCDTWDDVERARTRL